MTIVLSLDISAKISTQKNIMYGSTQNKNLEIAALCQINKDVNGIELSKYKTYESKNIF